MKKITAVVIMLVALNVVDAKTLKRPLIELGPKASLYISDDINFGIGVEAVVNPLDCFGFRIDLTEITFDPTAFYFNRNGVLDGFYYIPMQKAQLYVLAGVGLRTHDTGEGTQTHYSIRGGVGVNFPLNPKTTLFIEPTAIISGNGAADISLRLSGGARFGILK